MALMNNGVVTFCLKSYDADLNEKWIYKQVQATYFTNQTTKVINGELNQNADTLIFFKDDTYSLEANCNGSKWFLKQGDRVIIGKGRDYKKGLKIVQVTDYNQLSKMSHVEVVAR